MKKIRFIILYTGQILDLLGTESRKLPFLFVLFMVASVVELFGLGLIIPFTGMLVNPEKTMDLFFIKWLTDLGLTPDQNTLILALGLILVVMYILKGAIALSIQGLIGYYSARQKINLSNRMMKAYSTMPYSDFIKRNSADFINSLNTHIAGFSKTIFSFLQLISDGLVVVSIIALLAVANGMAIFLLLCLLIAFFLMHGRFIRSRYHQMGKSITIYAKLAFKAIQEGISGMKQNRILGTESYFRENLVHSIRSGQKIIILRDILTKSPRYILDALLVIFVVVLTAVTIFSGELIPSLIPVLGVFGVGGLRLVSCSNTIAIGLSIIKANQFSTQSLWDDLKYVNEAEQKCAGPLLNANKQIGEPTFQHLKMRSISFKYEGATKASLKEINFSLKKGDSIGIIGTSGAGKTTFIDVLLGLLNPQKGVIYLDDNKLIGDRWVYWRKQVAYIPQEIFLFDDSLKKNIALGIKEELIDDERLNKAVSQAQLRSLVEELPQGVDTIIGEHGVLLSGGQRQRIALARAFYFQRNVLIMDEATSALDDATEKEITKEIRMLKNKVTMIVIAHRFSTVQHCDKIYRLENGEIVAEGSFTEVVGTEGS